MVTAVRYIFLFLLFIFLMPISSMAQISTYKSTDNEGLNKKERIDTIENYLSDLSKKLKDIESKVESSGKKLTSLEDSLASLSIDLKKNQEELKEITAKITPAKKETSSKTKGPIQSELPNEEVSELDKIKMDVAAIKTQDIEKLKSELLKIKDKIQEMELNKSISNKK